MSPIGSFARSEGFALVTGANRGIGLEVAKLLAQKGKRVIVGVRQSSAGAETVAAVQKAVPDAAAVEAVVLDTGSSASISAAVQELQARFGRNVDVLVNNAGVLLPHRWDAEALAETLKVNVDGPLQLTRELAQHLAPASGALVVNVSSSYGKRQHQDPGYVEQLFQAKTVQDVRQAAGQWRESKVQGALDAGAYHASKLALNRVVQLLADDPQLAQTKVAVVAADPGWCRTDMGGKEATRSALQGAQSIAWWLDHYEPRLNGSVYVDGVPLDW